jgi:hypothetical protein
MILTGVFLCHFRNTSKNCKSLVTRASLLTHYTVFKPIPHNNSAAKQQHMILNQFGTLSSGDVISNSEMHAQLL